MNLKPFLHKTRFSLTLLIMAALTLSLLMTGCSSTPKVSQSPAVINPKEIKPTPVPRVEQPKPQEMVPSEITRNEPLKEESIYQTGWLLTSPDQKSTQEAVSGAIKFGVKNVQLGGDIINTVDDLILNPQKRDYVRAVASKLDQSGIETYVWSRELQMEGKTFIFQLNAPMVAARQAAYRYALKDNPQIDGVVLSFAGAMLNPWDVQIPEGYPNLSPAERIRFIVDMVKGVVVGEMQKKLLIRFDARTAEQKQWLAQVLDQYPAENLQVIVPMPLFSAYEQNSLDLYNASLVRHKVFIEYDLLGDKFGGSSMLCALPDLMYYKTQKYLGMNLAGGIGLVQGKSGTIANTANEINVFALFHIFKGKPIIADQIWNGWLERRYGVYASTREGDTLKRILQSSADTRKKMFLTKELPIIIGTNEPVPAASSLAYLFATDNENAVLGNFRYIKEELLTPKEQTLYDAAQEAFEAIEQTQKNRSSLEVLSGGLKPEDFEEFSRSFSMQDLISKVCFYAKQSYLGFKFWNATQSENEALYLESNLKNLEQLALEIDTEFGNNAAPARADQIRAFVNSIRGKFPKVLLGEKERTWNKIKNITVRQTGPQSAEISWKTEQLCTSTLFITSNLPIFDQMVPVSNEPTDEHRMLLQSLSPGKTFYYKIQCKTYDQKVVNSGIITFRLEGPAAL